MGSTLVTDESQSGRRTLLIHQQSQPVERGYNISKEKGKEKTKKTKKKKEGETVLSSDAGPASRRLVFLNLETKVCRFIHQGCFRKSCQHLM